MSTLAIKNFGIIALAVYAAYSYGRLAWLRRRSDRCTHEWAPVTRGMQCTRCRLIKGQRDT